MKMFIWWNKISDSYLRATDKLKKHRFKYMDYLFWLWFNSLRKIDISVKMWQKIINKAIKNAH
jgi:hypothetical protein